MNAFTKSLTTVLALFLFGFAVLAGRGTVVAQAAGHAASIDGANASEEADPRVAAGAYWVIYYRLSMGGAEALYYYGDGSLAKFSTKQSASDVARSMIKKGRWYSATWRQVGR